jgi:hypothetical protein
MTVAIVSDYSDVVLSSHRGLNTSEIIEDCLEKAKAMLQIIVTTDFDISSVPSESQRQYLSLLDDLVDLAHRQLMKLRKIN